MTVTQLNPPIPMSCPKGNGLAHFMIDYSPEFSICWVIFIDKTGECWSYMNEHIRALKNITLDRLLDKSGELPPQS